jgi:hypothetical protein
MGSVGLWVRHPVGSGWDKWDLDWTLFAGELRSGLDGVGRFSRGEATPTSLRIGGLSLGLRFEDWGSGLREVLVLGSAGSGGLWLAGHR